MKALINNFKNESRLIIHLEVHEYNPANVIVGGELCFMKIADKMMSNKTFPKIKFSSLTKFN